MIAGLPWTELYNQWEQGRWRKEKRLFASKWGLTKKTANAQLFAVRHLGQTVSPAVLAFSGAAIAQAINNCGRSQDRRTSPFEHTAPWCAGSSRKV
jgi:hypothetical protein